MRFGASLSGEQDCGRIPAGLQQHGWHSPLSASRVSWAALIGFLSDPVNLAPAKHPILKNAQLAAEQMLVDLGLDRAAVQGEGPQMGNLDRPRRLWAPRVAWDVLVSHRRVSANSSSVGRVWNGQPGSSHGAYRPEGALLFRPDEIAVARRGLMPWATRGWRELACESTECPWR